MTTDDESITPQAIHLQPGDILVLSLAYETGADRCEAIAHAMRDWLREQGSDHPVIVLQPGMSLAAMPPPAHWKQP